MAVSNVVSVGTSPTLLNTALEQDVNEGSSAFRSEKFGHSLIVRPQGGTVYVGGPNVTAGNGFPVGDGEALTADLKGEEQLYAITISGTISTRVLQVGI